MFGSRFLTIGPNPAFFQRLRSWFRQTWILDMGVSEILGPVPVIAKEAEAKLITTPTPFSVSASRAPALSTISPSSPAWMELRPIQGLRRQLRRRKGWSDLRKTHQLQAREESVGLLTAA
ncbi:hypothetical protein M406DRAFT_323096 [Cryphonectria parasitica EP155]|uniref:Uncharacterized protein n=1 Tax=Cryphonectria parasitica (strain ATCC 38755 / EP155) TaxID=660469 RepID=A0A9P4XXX6_CRYP1|nr:uncharacterized protein M406DRAFT_323096 [Cryphonectria parasitica EP155]KAF3763329.1 hypothetical protein M406DRAFT_323096 [Cryphonectria parasitica EP155]